MSTASVAPAIGHNYLNHEKGLWSWLTTVDHKRIGIMYLISVLTFFLLGGIFALLIRTELFFPGETIMGPDTYNKIMTFHGAIMVFMVLIPGIPAILGNFILPIMLGAKDVAFPRLNLASWYCFMAGALIAACALFFNRVDGGWTFYTPYSAKTGQGVLFVVVGAFTMGMSSILTGLNFIASIHKLRPKNMSMNQVPLFLWALYATSIIQILGTPVIAITLLLLGVEKTFQIGIFDPELGGDPILFQHFFWFYSHPAVYLMILPAFGVVSEIVTTFSRKVIFGYKAVAYSSFVIAFISFLVWGHHMFVSGQSYLAGLVFSLLSLLVGVPTSIKLFNWLATMYRGSLRFDTPLLWVLSFMFVFAIGGLTGIWLATLSADVHFHDTYFIVSHFHYTMVGGALMAFMGGLFYWFPKMFGKMYSDALGRISWFFVFLGFNVTFYPQFIAGSMGLPRRYFDYLPAFTELNQLSTIGSYMIFVGFFIGLIAIIHGLLYGEKASDNPWGGTTLEWKTSSPPIHENFETEPKIVPMYEKGGLYDYR